MKTVQLLAVAALAAAGFAQAQTPAPNRAAMSDMRGMSGMSTPKKAGPAAAAMSKGEVLKVMPDAVLLRHGPIQNIGMDAMTMQFNVRDPKILKSIKKGDKVRFAADRIDGQVVVTRIERAK